MPTNINVTDSVHTTLMLPLFAASKIIGLPTAQISLTEPSNDMSLGFPSFFNLVPDTRHPDGKVLVKVFSL